MLNVIKRIIKDKIVLYSYYCVLITTSTINKCLIRNFKSNKNRNFKKNIILILIGKIKKGGAERAAVNLAEKLAKNHEVIILTYADNTSNNIEQYECSVKCINIYGGNFAKQLYHIKKFKKDHQITHCISFGTRANFINSLTRKKDKVIISIRNYLSISETSKTYKTQHKISTLLCDYIVAVAKSVEKDQIEKYHINPKKITAISNYCNKEFIAESIKQYKIDKQDENIFDESLVENESKPKIIITVGKLKGQKGQWHLIRCFPKIIESNPNTKLIIIGTGELEEYLQDLIKKLNLEKNVFILGHKNNNIYTYMSKSDIFVFPTLFEGMPNVLLEAMQCDLPIIATDCYGANREILSLELDNETEIDKIEQCEYGILVPKLDFNQYDEKEPLTEQEKILAQAIIKMLNDENLLKQYKEKSKERVNHYNQEDYIKKWEELL